MNGAIPLSSEADANPSPVSPTRAQVVLWAASGLLLVVIYTHTFQGLYDDWTKPDSYYSHGFLVPAISLFFAWRKRAALKALVPEPSLWGYPLVIMASLMVVVSDFLEFRIISEVSLFPMMVGVILVLRGWPTLRELWFPIVFLVFMIPIPATISQSLILQVKLLATEGAVQLGQLLSFPMIRDGSYVRFHDDKLLVGEVCGGLRSLMALLAFGAITSYLSQARPWAQLAILLASIPIAIVSNVIRIFLLCVLAYFRGSEFAVGWPHDISGILIFVVAFILLFAAEAFFRKLAPKHVPQEAGP